jgi:molybdopterin molybdotransferase
VQELLDLDTALTRLLERTESVAASETLDLASAAGRVAAVDIAAPMSLPPFPSSAMDGYAVHGDDFTGAPPHELDVQGVSLAGAPFATALGRGRAVRVFTGAAMPSGADTVILQEDTYSEADRIFTTETPGIARHVREIGNDVHEGDVLISAGQRLGPFQVAWLRACGLTEVQVFCRPRVAVFATGDELIEAGQPLADGQIYESNRRVLAELMRPLPVEVLDLGILPDDVDVLRRELERAAADADVIITSGGVSVGDADYVKDVVQAIGRLEFWKLALKPGKPLAYGHIGNATFFGLPGNPVSTIVTFLLVAKPALQKWAGMMPDPVVRITAELATAITHSPGRAEYQRGTLTFSSDGPVVASTGDQGSNRLGSFRGANCLIEVPRDSGDIAAGAPVSVLPFAGLLS